MKTAVLPLRKKERRDSRRYRAKEVWPLDRAPARESGGPESLLLLFCLMIVGSDGNRVFYDMIGLLFKYLVSLQDMG